MVLAMCGYHGVRSYLTPMPMVEQARRAPERIFKNQCSQEQWREVERHWAQLERTLQRQREGTSIERPWVRGKDHEPTAKGQQTLHGYGESPGQQEAWATVGRMRARAPESAAEWSYHQRPEGVGAIVFDTSSMVPSPVCAPQGTWTATARHGQAVLHQHPRAWHCRH
jgi:hypothetical protein